MVTDRSPTRTLLARVPMLRLLDRLKTILPDFAVTVYVPPDSRAAGSTPALADALAAAPSWGTGAVAVWGDHLRLIITPPFPISEPTSFENVQVEPLRASLMAERALGIVLVRFGGYSVGVYRHGAFERTRTGGRFVKNRHRKGGQSQRRFDRMREGQVRQHFDDVGEAVRDVLLPVAGSLDGVVLGGDRHTLQAWLTRSPLPPALAARLLPRRIDTPEPRREVLERTPRAIWSSHIFCLRDDLNLLSSAATRRSESTDDGRE